MESSHLAETDKLRADPPLSSSQPIRQMSPARQRPLPAPLVPASRSIDNSLLSAYFEQQETQHSLHRLPHHNAELERQQASRVSWDEKRQQGITTLPRWACAPALRYSRSYSRSCGDFQQLKVSFATSKESGGTRK